jgi:hypothetical protein
VGTGLTATATFYLVQPPDTGNGGSGTTNSGLDFSPVFEFAQGISEQAQEGTQSVGSPLNVDLTGANVKVDGNIVTVKTATLTVVYVTDKTSQNVDSISVSTPSQEADIEGVGHVSASVEAELESITGNATINITLAKPEEGDVMDALYRAMEAIDREIQAVAYTMTVKTTNITANLPAKIYMNCTKEWVDLNAPDGDPNQVSIVRYADDKTTQVLATTWSYDEATGMYHFVGLSPDGLSVFGLVTAKATVTEKAENPNTTVVVASKSVVSTDVGMFAWLLSTLEQNPVLLVIVLAVVALVAYFGWWKRRL